ncbi:MAG: ABC transporter ATP-binding protein [Bacteroidia bacterium]|nr:ABC transporter ATP-binding protein [Bacteroidia bacterium]MCF8427972.1 ABC transporter ATP-binding protein [Bacteroidia bacterium]MCF8446316.1 ABC transporter ATP-binding protein [Bacteroidia bacterium]
MIQIKDLHKNYGKHQVLKNINVELERGMVAGLIGQNGTGKTTLIKSILGLTQFQKGDILVEGVSVKAGPEYRNNIGYMAQMGRYPENMNIAQLFDMMKKIRTIDKRDEELYEKFQLQKIAHQNLGQLSGGTIQKVSAALAFLFNPDILILDEPTAGLDPIASEILKEKIIKESTKKLILITSHILNDLDEIASHALFLQEGSLLFFEHIKSLKEKSGHQKLGKTIAEIMLERELKK